MNRAENAVDLLIQKMKKEKLLANTPEKAEYVIIIGDRIEQFDFAVEQFRKNKKLIHLWAGELGRCNDEDDIYRQFITLASSIQLCTSPEAKHRVEMLCGAIDKKPNAYVVGSLWYETLGDIDETDVPDEQYILVLYNPPTRRPNATIKSELVEISNLLSWYEYVETPPVKKFIWIEPNGDKKSYLVKEFVENLIFYKKMDIEFCSTIDRNAFLGLIKNTHGFVTNSSCASSEAIYLIPRCKIQHIGVRNASRESKTADMGIKNASDNIMKILRDI